MGELGILPFTITTLVGRSDLVIITNYLRLLRRFTPRKCFLQPIPNFIFLILEDFVFKKAFFYLTFLLLMDANLPIYRLVILIPINRDEGSCRIKDQIP